MSLSFSMIDPLALQVGAHGAAPFLDRLREAGPSLDLTELVGAAGTRSAVLPCL